MIYIVDAYAWIEYFGGFKEGMALDEIFNNQNNKFITLECTLAELKGFCLKHEVDFGEMQAIAKRNSIVLPVVLDNWINAAHIRFEMRKKIKNFGLIDSILIAKQNELNCKIVTGDHHFKNLKNVVFIG